MRILFFITLLLFLLKTEAQTNRASLTFQMSLPQGDYKKAYPKTGTGFIFGVVHHLQANPFIGIGGEMGLLQVSNDNTTYAGYYHNHYNYYYISATNYIFTVAAQLRIDLSAPHKSVKYFIDFSVGTNIFFTYSAISHDGGVDIIQVITEGDIIPPLPKNLKIDSSSSHSYWALRTGAGIGTEIPVGKNKKLSLLLKCSYLYGSNAQYYTHPDAQNLQISLRPDESGTSVFLAEAVIRFKIFNKKRTITELN
jgi:hypothetical protein